jgi:ApbE superfamily uncharacterized protein (UPF0280 family)
MATKKKANNKKEAVIVLRASETREALTAEKLDQMMESVFDIIATTNKGLHHILRENPAYPSPQTFYKIMKNSPSFMDRYARAKEIQADLLVAECITIADETSNDIVGNEEEGYRVNAEAINRSRLRVDTRKWLASKLAQKKYGDKLDVTTDGEKINIPTAIKWGDKVISI